MIRSVRVVALLAAAAVIPACAVVINLKDGTARVDGCPGVEFTIIVEQGPHKPSTKATPSGGIVRFKSGDFKDIDFSKRVKVTVFASKVPPGSECQLRAGVKYVLENDVLPPVPGESDTYEADLAKFKQVP
jgi:hypothetical protein